jgi:alpha/beta superfamily hydrolase
MGGISYNETSYSIPGSAGLIEAAVTKGAGFLTGAAQALVVICHPHPEHGGTMDNKVVTTLVRIYRDLGVTAIRFNFRGVGKSEGKFDKGVGELDDLLAVVAWAKQEIPYRHLLLAGFSFGSSIAAQACFGDLNPAHLLLVAPPVTRYSYDQGGQFPCPVCVVQGGKDERVEAGKVYEWTESLSSPVDIVRYPEAGHFFHGYLVQLKNDVSPLIKARLPALDIGDH